MTETEFVGKWHLRFADNDMFAIDEGDLREFADDIAATFGTDDPRVVFQEILENQYGKHPAFKTSQAEVNAYLLQRLTAQQGLLAPDAPTFNGFNDVANTVAIAHPDFSYADLRYDFNGQLGLLVPADGIIKVGNVAGQVAGYVRAAGGRAQGNKSYSPAFTTTAVATPNPNPISSGLLTVDVFDVSLAKRKEVVEADEPLYVDSEQSTALIGKQFIEGGDTMYHYQCMPLPGPEGPNLLVWKRSYIE